MQGRGSSCVLIEMLAFKMTVVCECMKYFCAVSCPRVSQCAFQTPALSTKRPFLVISSFLLLLCMVLAMSSHSFDLGHTLLCQKQAIPLFQRHSVSRVFVVRGESGRMCGFRDGSVKDFLQGVDALAVGVFVVHEMHLGCGGQ